MLYNIYYAIEMVSYMFETILQTSWSIEISRLITRLIVYKQNVSHQGVGLLK
jgi:hypothetical protein